MPPYATGPYDQHSSLPSPTSTVVVAARKVDYTTNRYQFDANGNPVGMNPTAQRVLLSVAFSGALVDVIDERNLNERRARIEASLKELVDEGVIKDVAVVVEERGGGEVYEQVKYFNLTTAKNESTTWP